jgi:hypothetical protein
LRATGDLAASRQVLQQSLDVATAIANPQAVGEALLSLGNTAAAQRETAATIGFYQQAATYALLTTVPAQLHQLDLLLETQQLEAAQSLKPSPEPKLCVRLKLVCCKHQNTSFHYFGPPTS